VKCKITFTTRWKVVKLGKEVAFTSPGQVKSIWYQSILQVLKCAVLEICAQEVIWAAPKRNVRSDHQFKSSCSKNMKLKLYPTQVKSTKVKQESSAFSQSWSTRFKSPKQRSHIHPITNSNSPTMTREVQENILCHLVVRSSSHTKVMWSNQMVPEVDLCHLVESKVETEVHLQQVYLQCFSREVANFKKKSGSSLHVCQK